MNGSWCYGRSRTDGTAVQMPTGAGGAREDSPAGCWRPGSLEVWKAGTSILPDNNPDCCMAMRMGNVDVLALLLPRSDGGFPGCSGAATEARHSAATMLLPSLAKGQSSSHCHYESVI